MNMYSKHWRMYSNSSLALVVFINFLRLSCIHSQSRDIFDRDACPPSENAQALRLFERGLKEKGLERKKLFAEAAKLNEDCYEAHFQLGLIYVREQEARLAKYRLEQVMRLCPDYSPYTWFWLGNIYYGEGRYTESIEMLKKVVGYKGEKAAFDDKDFFEAQKLLKQAEAMVDLTRNRVAFEPRPVEDICTEQDEYLAMLSPDNSRMFFTRKVPAPGTAVGYKEIFMEAQNNNWHFDRGRPMPAPFNTVFNNGASFMTADEKYLYFVMCENNEVSKCDIYYTKRDGPGWDVINRPPGINSEVWDSQPTLSYDGQTMIFSSTRKGGLGGADLWVSQRRSDGSWETPQNLGPVINSPENDLMPFLHTDGKTLYFSSKGHKGLGGYDIFYSRKGENGQWGPPVNIGAPINTEGDELGFFVSLDGTRAFFTSDKLAGGKGGRDVFTFPLYEAARPEQVRLIKGRLEADNNNPDADVVLKNLSSREASLVRVDREDGRFVAVVKADDDYLLTVRKQGAAFSSQLISASDTTPLVPEVKLEQKQLKKGEAYRLNDIYFATNSATLTPKAMFTIQAFAEFLKENPDVRVAIHGHTDNVGNDNDNLTLSRQRARAVYDALLDQGIPPQRLQHEGFGESRPIADNTTPEGRAKNRRTEFVIL